MKLLYVNIGRPTISGATTTVKELLSRLPDYGIEVGLIEVVSKKEAGLLDTFPDLKNKVKLEDKIVLPSDSKQYRLIRKIYLSTIFKNRINKISRKYDFVIGASTRNSINMIYTEPFIFHPLWKFYMELIKKTNPIDGTFWFISSISNLKRYRKNKNNICAGLILSNSLKENYGIDCYPMDPPAGVDLESARRAKPLMDLDAIQVSRVGFMKGTHDTIEVMKRLKEKGYNKLAIAGPIDHDFNLEEKIKDTGISYLGEVSRDMIFSTMKSGKVFIYPTYIDSFGIVVAEALACGVPVVTYDIPAMTHYYGKCDAVRIVKTGNVEEMTRETLNILSNYEKYSKIALECSEMFSWEYTVSSFIGILDKTKNEI
ncbi:glycosyltransferase family 4 protein [Sulfuracidifex tepidarius]|uniref:D-inositol-3-phosphate glycosyltransferase n=1 Tax=Sulfuracidifex tepidarius TaxID=1294262 RepID=A0A510E6L1_9CREN|nr:glycosyltransferase family 4 protein [Sulfuracidifex tepidarius]BBG24883.1 D-inositol-3-phosphate glycosyltransferase [Sulfuracidifex tepidarius]BBG27668.1 D-inositol-3-phosphate glycosyltransferase [Sulfuracidifex tepidarius]